MGSGKKKRTRTGVDEVWMHGVKVGLRWGCFRPNHTALLPSVFRCFYVLTHCTVG